VFCRVPVRTIPAVRVPQRKSQAFDFPRNGDEMDMVRHQTVAQQCYAVQFQVLPKQVKIDLAIRIVSEDKSPRIPALGYVVG
jgi:hypothetical protein